MLPLIAIPVVHSAGGWIASTAAAGYLGGTLSASWAGAFIAGNASLLAGTAAAAGTGIAGYVTGIAGAGASALGFAPATFLGLTPVGWAIAGGAVLTASSIAGLSYWKSKPFRDAIDAVLPDINAARIEGGLEPFKNPWELIKSLKGEAQVQVLPEVEDSAEARARGAIAS